MIMTTKVSTFQSNIELEKEQAALCKRLAIRFAVETFGWDQETVIYRPATTAENYAGVDAFVSAPGKKERGIDFKIRREGTCKYWRNGIPDIAIELKQPTTYGWATMPGKDPNVYIMFVFLDALYSRGVPMACTVTLGTCQELVDIQERDRRFPVKKANNGYGWSENMIVTLDDMNEMYATYWLTNKEAA
jgi:hypothetical protein